MAFRSGLRACSLLALVACSSKSSHPVLKVAAASDLTHAFTEIANEFEAKSGIHPEISFAASGLLAKQIEEGAPFALYAAANKSFVDQVLDKGHCDRATERIFTRGTLVLWTRGTTPISFASLADPTIKRIAIANPEHAPYGTAAKQALQKAGLWDKLDGRVVVAENIQATMELARTGNVDAALISRSLVIAAEGGAATPVDPTLYAPLDQAIAVCGTGEDATRAQQFADFILSDKGKEILGRHGFVDPTAAVANGH